MKIIMKIKQKILLFLSIFVLMVGTAFAELYGEYAETGFIKLVTTTDEGLCRLLFISKLHPDNQSSGDWWCGTSSGKNILDLAKTALIQERRVIVVFRDNGKKVKQVLGISLQ